MPSSVTARHAPRTAAGGMSDALTIARQQRGRRLAELETWLAIPSVSPDPTRAGEVHEAAAWLAAWLRALGADVQQLLTADGWPVVAGRIDGPPTAPVALV